jgi:hypothetical protein
MMVKNYANSRDAEGGYYRGTSLKTLSKTTEVSVRISGTLALISEPNTIRIQFSRR